MIHKTAIIDKNAKISSNVEIGPYCIIGPNVEIDSGTKLYSHVNRLGWAVVETRPFLYGDLSFDVSSQCLEFFKFHCRIFLLVWVAVGAGPFSHGHV